MLTMHEMNKKLRRADQKQYRLYVFCNFVALLLITAYAAMMFSPTVLNVLPEGGDSRKQMIAIFVLACVGCVVFTAYAASLFFRHKSKKIGVMMALGASKKVDAGILRGSVYAQRHIFRLRDRRRRSLCVDFVAVFSSILSGQRGNDADF